MKQNYFILALIFWGFGVSSCADVRKETLSNIAFQADSATVTLYRSDFGFSLDAISIPVFDKQEWQTWPDFSMVDEVPDSVFTPEGALRYFKNGRQIFEFEFMLEDSNPVVQYETLDKVYYSKLNSEGVVYLKGKLAEVKKSGAPKAIFDQLLNWLIGDWEQVDEGKTQTEKWAKTDELTLSGFGCTIRKGDTVFTEELAIIIRENEVFYVANVAHNQGPVEFKLVEKGDKYLRFENPEHDFPQVITYQQMEDASLYVIVENNGDIEEEDYKSLEFYFSKVEKKEE